MDIYCDCWIQNQYVKSQDADFNRIFHKRGNDFLFICLCRTFMTENKTNSVHCTYDYACDRIILAIEILNCSETLLLYGGGTTRMNFNYVSKI